MSSQAANASDDGNDMSLDELNAIMNLQRQEAFDETLEEVHANLSKRETIRRKISSGPPSKSRPPPSPHNNRTIIGTEHNVENAESKLLQIITSQAAGPSSSPTPNSFDTLAGSNPRTKHRATHRYSPSSGNISMSSADDQSVGTNFSRRSADQRGSGSKRGDSGGRVRSRSQGRLGSSSSGRQRSKSVSNDIDRQSPLPPSSSRGRISRTISGNSKDAASSSKGNVPSRRRSPSRKESPSSRKRSSSRKESGRSSRRNPSSTDKDENDYGSSKVDLELEQALKDLTYLAGRKGTVTDSVDAGETSSYSSRSVSRNSPVGGVARTPRSVRPGASARINVNSRKQERHGSGSRSEDSDELKAFVDKFTTDNQGRSDQRDNVGSTDKRAEMTKQNSSLSLSDQQGSSNGRNNYESHTRKAYGSKSVEREIDRHTTDHDSSTMPRKSKPGADDGKFDRIWKEELGHNSELLDDFLKGGSQSNNASRVPSDLLSVPATPVGGSRRPRISSKSDYSSVAGERTKKTKLEKIQELQAKCDRYKKEWMDASNDKRRYRRDLDTVKAQAVSLSKQVETHVMETAILQKNLKQALLTLDETHEEQRKERNEYSNTAKDLAQARIDHAKSVNECRELRSQLDQREQQLAERDREMDALKADLIASKDNIEHLEADIAYADEQIEKLEHEIKTIEEEVHMYREAADKSTSDQNGSSENLRGVRDEMEKRLHEEREGRLDEKQRKLEERIKQFEEEKERHLESQKAKEREFLELKEREGEKSKARDEDRQKLDDEINARLKMLENDNTALQGRLKSEQLDSTMKLKSKDEIIENLQQELMQLKKDIQQRDADPSSLAAMQEAIEAIRTEASNTKLDLEEAQKQNGMMQDEVDDLRVVNNEMKSWVTTLQDKVDEQKKEIETLRRKADEWLKKSGEWSAKAFQWKEKAEHWEKTAKSLDPDAKTEKGSSFAQADPQALFLAAAVEKKKTSHAANNGTSSWLGGIFNKVTDAEDGSEIRIDELEVENAKQSVEIKQLKSEMVRMQTMYKDIGYGNQQKIEQLQKENEAIGLKCLNLAKELELARKLNHSMTENND